MLMTELPAGTLVEAIIRNRTVKLVVDDDGAVYHRDSGMLIGSVNLMKGEEEQRVDDEEAAQRLIDNLIKARGRKEINRLLNDLDREKKS